MKVDLFETHDRYKHFTKQEFSISECCQDLINQRPFDMFPFYIFVHARSEDNTMDKRLIWQPRLTKPLAQTNSMLFKAYPGNDLIKEIWILPPQEYWNEYTDGKVAGSKIIYESIYNYRFHKERLEAKEKDDLDDDTIRQIYIQKYSKKNLII